MKYKLLYAVVTVQLLFTACSDFLDTASPSEQSAQAIFENEGMAKAAVMGVYSYLGDTYVYGQKMSVNWQGNSDTDMSNGFMENPSSDKNGDSGPANFWADWYNKTTQWGNIFKLTELASTAVDGIRNSKLYEEGSITMKYLLGEALTLRSLAYLELVRRWGDVPFKDGIANSDLSNVYMGKINRDSIYPFLIRDMQEAVECLPWVGEVGDYNCERVTKGFAKGLLARIALFAGGWSIRDGNQFSDANVEHYPNLENNPCMKEMNNYYVGRTKDWRKYYEIAEEQCAEIIGDPQNPHQLDPDYGNIWKTVCHLDYNPYNENMFEVANGLGYSGDIGSLMGRRMDNKPENFGGSYACSNAFYFYSFLPQDKRRDYACYWATYKKDNTYVREVMGNNIMGVSYGKWGYFWTCDAYRNLLLTATSRVPTGINWILMRYPDIFLMFAEARYGLGKGEDTVNEKAGISARQALEKVRERAFGTGSPEIKKYDADFFNAIVNERAWEFGGEAIRKLDLIRWGLLDQKIEEMKEAMLLMLDGTQTIKIFDRVYEPSDFPDKLYFKYDKNNEFIDWESVNFYERLAFNPDQNVYTEVNWFPVNNWNLEDERRVNDLVNNSVKILLYASGLRASYNYDELFSKLKYGDLIKKKFITMTAGNGVCNYRHLYPIYYDDIYKSKGYLENSYGYDYK